MSWSDLDRTDAGGEAAHSRLMLFALIPVAVVGRQPRAWPGPSLAVLSTNGADPLVDAGVAQ
jgi:hypothetical protein